jgi:predicted SAM-dependent methyltransferase
MPKDNSVIAAQLPKKLNLGCGFDRREGFFNVDLQEFHEPDLVADVVDLGKLPSSYFNFILAQDVLEHLEREKVPKALDEWARLLEPNGVVEIRIPSLLDMFCLLSTPERRQPEKAREIIQLIFGTQAYNGDYHLSGFTSEVLDDLISEAGLKISYAHLKDEWLFEIRARKTEKLDDNSEFVHNAYFRILGRPVDPAGLLENATALEQGRLSRAELERALTGSVEARFLSQYPRYLWPYIGKPIGENFHDATPSQPKAARSKRSKPTRSNVLRRVAQKFGFGGGVTG